MFNTRNQKYPLFTFAIALFVGGIPNPSSAAEFKFPDQVDIQGLLKKLLKSTGLLINDFTQLQA